VWSVDFCKRHATHRWFDRVLVVGEEPPLEAFRATDGTMQSIQPMVQTSLDLPAQEPWRPWQQIPLSNLFQPVPPIPAANGTLFLRAVRQ
jgi:hypothetical protein